MHSSRMRTARLLPVSPSMQCSRECTCPGTPPPCEQISWHTLLKILPCPNFLAGGKNDSHCIFLSHRSHIYLRHGKCSSEWPWMMDISSNGIRWEPWTPELMENVTARARLNIYVNWLPRLTMCTLNASKITPQMSPLFKAVNEI